MVTRVELVLVRMPVESAELDGDPPVRQQDVKLQRLDKGAVAGDHPLAPRPKSVADGRLVARLRKLDAVPVAPFAARIVGDLQKRGDLAQRAPLEEGTEGVAVL